MNYPIEKCGGKLGCSSEAIYVCNCSNPVTYLCSNCIHHHISRPLTHTFISLEQGRYLASNPDCTQRFNEGLCKYYNLKHALDSYINSIQIYQEYIKKAKTKVINSIENDFNYIIDYLEDHCNKAQIQRERVNNRMNTFITPGDEMLHNFDSEGLKGVLDCYIESFDEITAAIRDSITNLLNIFTHALVENDTIYYPKQNSTILLKYEARKNHLNHIDIARGVSTEFNFSSSCVLPDGNLMIVSKYNPDNGDTYKFDTQTYQVTKLAPLNNTRSMVGLICHNKYLYAFGGYNSNGVSASKKVERMEWGGDGWIDLIDMNEARVCFGIVAVGYKICLIGGFKCSSVEYYDILKNRFYYIPGLATPDSEGCSAVLLDDRIYLLCSNKIQVLRKDFSIEEVMPSNVSLFNDTLNSTVVIDRKAYFHSYRSYSLSMFDMDAKEIYQVIQDL